MINVRRQARKIVCNCEWPCVLTGPHPTETPRCSDSRCCSAGGSTEVKNSFGMVLIGPPPRALLPVRTIVAGTLWKNAAHMAAMVVRITLPRLPADGHGGRRRRRQMRAADPERRERPAAAALFAGVAGAAGAAVAVGDLGAVRRAVAAPDLRAQAVLRATVAVARAGAFPRRVAVRVGLGQALQHLVAALVAGVVVATGHPGGLHRARDALGLRDGAVEHDVRAEGQGLAGLAGVLALDGQRVVAGAERDVVGVVVLADHVAVDPDEGGGRAREVAGRRQPH